MYNEPQLNDRNNVGDDRYSGMSKNQVYKLSINQGKEPPSIDARCSTKAYCCDYADGRVYTVLKADLLTFEARLSPSETQKSAFYSITGLMSKLDRLLELKGKPRLGFPDGTLPDDLWFSRVLR